MPARCRLLASKEDPVPSARVLSEERPLPCSDISRSHQLAWMSGFGGTRSPFARDIKQSNVPGSQDLGRSAPLRKTGAPCGIRTHGAARPRWWARARSNRLALLGWHLHARIGKVGSLSRGVRAPRAWRSCTRSFSDPQSRWYFAEWAVRPPTTRQISGISKNRWSARLLFQLHERQREIANPLSRVCKHRNDALYPLSIVGSHKMRVARTDDRRASAVEFRAVALTPDVGSKRSVPVPVLRS
jgi:hypothetical protein